SVGDVRLHEVDCLAGKGRHECLPPEPPLPRRNRHWGRTPDVNQGVEVVRRTRFLKPHRLELRDLASYLSRRSDVKPAVALDEQLDVASHGEPDGINLSECTVQLLGRYCEVVVFEWIPLQAAETAVDGSSCGGGVIIRRSAC